MRTVLAMLCLAALVGCGSRPSPGPVAAPTAPGARTIAGRVVLAPGSVLSPANLRVSTECGDAPLAADGTFVVAAPAEREAAIYFVQRAGTDEVVFLATRTTPVVGSASTATALIFYASGAFRDPEPTWDAWLKLIAAEKATARVAAAIDASLARSATPLSDPAVTAAVRSAAAELVHGVGR